MMSVRTLAAAIVVLLPGAASAADVCPASDKSQWMSVEAVHERLADLGYADYHLGIEDGCYEAKLVAANGDKLEVYIDPVSGEVVRTVTD